MIVEKARSAACAVGIVLCLGTSCGWTAEEGWKTFANPLDVSYRVLRNGPAYSDFATPADPEIIWHAGAYWLFASKGGGYFTSSDLVTWRWIEKPQVPTEEWAPTVAAVGGKLHYTARGGTVHREVDLAAGRWEKLPCKVPYSVDSALFADDDGRLYLYWGGDRGRNPVFGCELDPRTFAAKTEVLPLFDVDMNRYGWEVRGDGNEQTDGYSYVEGAHMFRRGGRYYLQYAASGTQFASYSDTALVGAAPLGPFRRQRTNPFSYKSTGYIPSAGHGKTFEDRYGNVWHVTTGLVEGFNRRLVMFPVFFDADGEMWCDTAFGDWPFAVPDRKVFSAEELRTGWMELAEGKTAAASSAAEGCPAARAVDNRIATAWTASSGRSGEWLSVDFGGPATVRAIQIGFGGVVRTRSYRIEAKEGGGTWRTIVDEREGRPFAEHPYYPLTKPVSALGLRLVNAADQDEPFSVRGLRAFGTMDKPRPVAPRGIRVVRDTADRRHATVSWEPAEGASGYLVRFGVSPEKLHLSRTAKSCRIDVRSLDAEEDYVWSVAGYNEAGFGAAVFGQQVLNDSQGK